MENQNIENQAIQLTKEDFASDQVSEALANITPTSGDVIKNMDGVTTFTGGIWQGSLPNLDRKSVG